MSLRAAPHRSSGTSNAPATWWRSLRVWVAGAAVLLFAGTLLGAAGAWIEHDSQASSRAQVRENLRPAQVDVESLIRSYDDQETALRGFLLTGDVSVLEELDSATARAAVLVGELEGHLEGRATALAKLAAVAESGRGWLTDIARPQIAARSSSPLTQDRIDEFVDRGREVFDRLRERVATLSDEVASLISARLDEFDSRQRTAGVLVWFAFACALAGMAVLGLVLWVMGSRPLRRLVADVELVAAGDVDHHIAARGVQEYARIGRAAGAMRDSLVARSQEVAHAREQMAVLGERQRLASDLHDLTIQRVFALGLSISALAARDPTNVRAVVDLVGETDAIITELRQVIFELQVAEPSATLRESLEATVRAGTDSLGHTARLSVVGPLEDVPPDVATDALAVVREALSNVIKHAHAQATTVEIRVVPGEIEVFVEDDGIGLDPRATAGSGTWSRQFRAERHAGDVHLTSSGGGTRLRWRATWPHGAPWPASDIPGSGEVLRP